MGFTEGVRQVARAGTTGLPHRVKAAAGVTAAAAVLTGAPAVIAAPAATAATAADPSSQFDVRYGATYGVGTIRWHQRSVDVDYSLKASYCRRLYAFAHDANGNERSRRSTSLHCNDVSSDTWNLPVDIPGGPHYVIICLADETDHYVSCEQYDRP
ncbi:hypothetical protein OHS58_03760 [Amycolatopsis sp. NBC_00348]|uniref:hypothetical protein n=1 Tax=Amycolatopsis sp. NBC_00348 TaxID=2975956 RepID=UPI002E25E86B